MIGELFSDESSTPPTEIGPSDDLVPLERLQSGAVIQRYTDPDDGEDPEDYERVKCKAPCCLRWFRITYEFRSANRTLVLCTFCSSAYEAQIIRESDGGYLIILTVDEIPFVVTERRRRKR